MADLFDRLTNQLPEFSELPENKGIHNHTFWRQLIQIDLITITVAQMKAQWSMDASAQADLDTFIAKYQSLTGLVDQLHFLEFSEGWMQSATSVDAMTDPPIDYLSKSAYWAEVNRIWP